MKAIELLGRRNILIKVINRYQERNNTTGAEKFDFPETIYITDIMQVNGKNIDLSFPYNNTTKQVYVPLDFEVEEINDALLIKEYMSSVALRSQLSHGGLFLGSDPEMFVENSKGDLIPAFHFLGSKDIPNKTWNSTYGNQTMYWDGYQAEFTTSPQSCLGHHVDSVHAGLKGLLIAARKHDPTARLSVKTTFDVPQDNLNNDKDEHVNFGCMPSLNAYGLEGLKVNGREVDYRSAGGHIHIGYNKGTEEETKRIVRAMDSILGVACVGLFANYDEPRRRRMYGLPGEYRLPAHGIEYRVLSNAWLFHPLIMNLVFDIARKSFVIGRNNLLLYWQAEEKETIDTIKFCDIDQAKIILERNKKVFMQILMSCYHTDKAMENIFDAFKNGMDNIVSDPKDVGGNWNLDSEWRTHSDGVGKNVLYSKDILIKGKKVS